MRMPRFFKRLFKFPQMDFEMAIWEIMSLIIAPKKVFRQIYYHVCFVDWLWTVFETNVGRNKPPKPTIDPIHPSPTCSRSSSR